MRLRLFSGPVVLRQVLMAVGLGLTVATASAAGPAAPKVQDPHYGDTLFQFFQARYFSAITGLMVSQHFNRVSHHADDAEVLRGGMLLSYGLHREAGEIFAGLIDKSASPAVRDRAWFFLAKIRYQRALFTEAEDALGRIGKNLPPDLEEERGLLHAQVLMARGDYAGAARVLGALTGVAGKDAASADEKTRYARFNLGVALLRGGDAARGVALLDELGKLPASNEEYRSLRDRANVALGYTALQQDQPEKARIYLERVRLSGQHANKALLGFGWAAASLKQPKLALVPWTELAERDASDAAVLEGRIAVAYAFAELGAYGQSLGRYQQAIAAFEQENRALDESIAAIRAGKLVDGLLARNPGEEMGWFWTIGQLPELPHRTHLTQVLAQHEFQEAFKNYRDLKFLDRNLAGWADNLGIFGDMLANRRQAFAERLPKVRAQAQGIGIDALQQRAEALAAELLRAEAESAGRAFADPKQADFLARVARLKSLLAQGGGDADLAAARDRVRRVSGALTWQLAQDHSARLWDTKKAMRTTEIGLAEARRQDTALAQAQRDEPARFEVFAQRIAELDKRLQALRPRVAALGTEQQQQVQDLAVAELNRQKERLAIYTTQARFAVAQLYDRANSGPDAASSDADKNAPNNLRNKDADAAPR
jgi:hypothetical protein